MWFVEEKCMSTSIEALFDGEVFRPEEPLKLQPNTRVRITIESNLAAKGDPHSFFHTARSLNLDGPADWSRRIDEYLYGEEAGA
jgi:predicted DNA-binding antitoxin AbrB/MazE fold protein